jgi:hypothetical protein
MSTRLLSVAMVFLALSGCVAVGPRFIYPGQPEGTDSKIYLYRKYNFVGSAGSPNVYLDGVRQGKLHTGGYVQMVVREGQHELVIGKLGGDHPNWAPANATYIVDAGKGLEFFLRMAIDFSGVSTYVVPIGPSPIIGSSGAAGITIETLDRDTAIEELSRTSESD